MHNVRALNRPPVLQWAGLSAEGPIASRLTLARDARGAMLLETIVATMVFALVGVAVLSGLSTAYTAGSKIEEQSVAENIARNQMEHVFAQPYQPPEETPYPTYSAVPTGYSVDVVAEHVDPGSPDSNIERITVTVDRTGGGTLVLKTLRFNEEQ